MMHAAGVMIIGIRWLLLVYWLEYHGVLVESTDHPKLISTVIAHWIIAWAWAWCVSIWRGCWLMMMIQGILMWH